MKTLEEGEVCIAVPDWLLALGTYGVADVVEVIESDDGGKARIRFDWPLEFKRMSGTVDTCLRMDGCHIRGRTIKNKRRDVQQNLETQVTADDFSLTRVFLDVLSGVSTFMLRRHTTMQGVFSNRFVQVTAWGCGDEGT